MKIISHQPALQPLLIRRATRAFFPFLNVVCADEALVKVHDALLQMNILARLEKPIKLEPVVMQIYKNVLTKKNISTLKKKQKDSLHLDWNKHFTACGRMYIGSS